MAAIERRPIVEAGAQDRKFALLTSAVAKRSEPDGLGNLRIALRLVGLTFIFGIYALVILWPSGWSWHTGHSFQVPHYLQMILGVYATLGVFLLRASRSPRAHLSLIWFTVWSSVVHAGIMAVQAAVNLEDRGHLLGDVPALLIVAAVLALLTPRGSATQARETRRG